MPPSSGLTFSLPENNQMPSGGMNDDAMERQSVNSMDEFEARLNALKKL